MLTAITAGTTFAATITLPDYPAGEGWEAKLVAVKGPDRIEMTGTADGDLHALSVDAATTAAWKPGVYQAFVYAEKAGEKRLADGPAEWRVWADPTAATLTLSALETELAAIDTAIAAVVAGKGVQSYTFQTQAGARSVTRMTLAELRQHRAWVVDRLDEERAKQEGRRPRGGWRKIKTSFGKR